MKLFFDTSALVKYFYEEEGSREVTSLITSEENETWISELARLEFLSALLRRFRNKEISEDKLNTAIYGFEEECASFNMEPVGHAVINEANFLLKKYGKIEGLRTLDALHLGTFSLISGDDWIFVTADEGLCGAAQSAGFKILNPLRKDAAA